MTIKVYWACLEDEWMLASEPESVAKKFYKGYKPDPTWAPTQVNKCPVFNESFKNLYTMKSVYDYEFTFDPETKTFNSPMYDEAWFNDHILVRSAETRFFSFKNRYIFFTDAQSLPTSFYEYPYLEQNGVTKACLPTQGKYDIGKWFRHSEFPFFLKEGENTFKVNVNDVYSYIRFHTDEKIDFVQFRFSDKLEQYRKDGESLNKAGNLKKMSKYYAAFKNKNAILEEIKKNLIL
jgi:hypothetical protein